MNSNEGQIREIANCGGAAKFRASEDVCPKNLLTARSVSGHFVPPMGSRKSPPKAGLARLGWTRTPKNEP